MINDEPMTPEQEQAAKALQDAVAAVNQAADRCYAVGLEPGVGFEVSEGKPVYSRYLREPVGHIMGSLRVIANPVPLPPRVPLMTPEEQARIEAEVDAMELLDAMDMEADE